MAMSRKQRKKPGSNSNDSADGQERPDYSDVKQLEAMIRKTFSNSRENLRWRCLDPAKQLDHSNYYKIINTIRTHGIPLHYFQFVSAEKCAAQLALEDQKST